MRTDHGYLKFLTKLRMKYIWRRILLERLTEPVHLNLLSILVVLFGSFRARVAFDLILRHHHAYGILGAADEAKELGIGRVTLLEFGVATGAGILNMAKVARRVSQVTGVQFEIYGFDTGHGMPVAQSAKDHPELYQAGDFVMDIAKLRRALPENAKVVLGDLAMTGPEFVKQLNAAAPVGFVSLDLDYYSSSKDALRMLLGSPEYYLPRTFLYVDDIEHPSHNSFCGEQVAIAEFNDENETRKIERWQFLSRYRVFHRAPWILHMYTLHVLDHPTRTNLDEGREPITLANPYLGIRARG